MNRQKENFFLKLKENVVVTNVAILLLELVMMNLEIIPNISFKLKPEIQHLMTMKMFADT